jgi:DNA modification methylase
MPPKKKPPAGWQNRIVGQEDVAPDQLLANPLNWRRHPGAQEQALTEALDRLGWIQRVVVNRTTGHVVDGHLRVAVALSKGEPTVPVAYVELDPQEERLALATLDPLSALAVADDELLKGLLAEVRPYVEDGSLSELLTDLATGRLIDIGQPVELDQILGDIEDEEKAPPVPVTEEEGQRLDETGRAVIEQEPTELERLVARWGVEPGQTWWIPSGTVQGKEHVLHVGDATSDLAFGPLMAYLPKGTVIVTSPPYGMGQDYEAQYQDKSPDHARKTSNARRDPQGKRDHRGPDQEGGRPTVEGVDEWIRLVSDFCSLWSRHVHGAAINLADHTVSPTPGYGMHSYGLLVNACAAAGWAYVATRMWVKPPGLGNNPYWLNSYKAIPEFEYVGFFQSPGKFPFRPVSERVPQTEAWRYRSRWEFGSVHSQQLAKGFHPAAFPTELPRRCVLLFSDPGGTVADPFLGSGTTMVAAERLGRVCVGVEQSPVFAAMALERMSRLGLSPRSKH